MARLPKIAIIYASSLGRTRLMAESIAEGARTVDGIDLLLKDVSYATPADVTDAAVVMLGGSTYGHKLISSMEPFLKELEKVDLKGKVGVAFGSYGWSGEGVPDLMKRMTSFGMKMVEPGFTAKQEPNDAVIRECFMLGKTIAEGIKS